MHFASPLPWWLVVLVAAGILSLAIAAYRRPLAPLARWQQAGLASLRALLLALLVAMLARPSILTAPRDPRDSVVPVLVDVSRSMRIPDADGRPRIEQAAAILKEQLLPELSTRFQPELYVFGDVLAPADAAQWSADARQSNLADAVRAVVDRYRGRPVAGVIVLSDGADTGRGPTADRNAVTPPIVTVGLGSVEGLADREIIGLSAADPRLDQTTVDVRVSAVSRGFGREPFQVRLTADGRLVEVRNVAPVADGSPIDETFTVSPDATRPTVVTATIVDEGGEAIVENNLRSVIVSPVGRRRRLLVMAGAPGYDHSFLVRALTRDPGLDVDVVVRKGKDDLGRDTFLVQAGGGRASSLTSGFPDTREALFVYDALVVANLESEFFTRAQLQSMADFVSERGGGLVVFGGRSFTRRGLMGTPLEDVLPVELADRRGGLTRAAYDAERAARPHAVTLTADGRDHPVMRIGATAAETERLWSALPPLASSAPLGGPRPGATILAVTSQPEGGIVPLVAVQRYGRGRSMIFGGEGSWRWKMMAASSDRSYEYFWRQAARWLAGPSPDPVTIMAPEGLEPGDSVALTVDARDSSYAPSAGASIEATLTAPGGEVSSPPFQKDAASQGRLMGPFRPDRAGLYHLRVQARADGVLLGVADRWLHVGGSDGEMTDPRLNAGVLRRLAQATGGRFVEAGRASEVPAWLESDVSVRGAPTRRDLWHEPWVYGVLVAIMIAEWTLRRRWGLR